jgi:propanol-preferring alcohol dehydrogenase
MVLREPRRALELEQRPDPTPGVGEVLIRIEACAVCRTDLHVVDGELSPPRLPVVPGHEIVGVVEARGTSVAGITPGERVGVPWLGHTCGVCAFCRSGDENLCDAPVFTGHGRDGGFASHVVAEAAYCVRLPSAADPLRLAPLLCAGLIGWRSLRMAGPGIRELGLYGFGAAAHLVAQVAQREGARVHAFTRPGDVQAQAFARDLGAVWAGGSNERPPTVLDAAILFAPTGALVPAALAAVRKGGRVVCGGIHMSDIPSFAYDLLWGERQVRSVANLTRRDAAEFFAFVARHPLRVDAIAYPLERANDALDDLRAGRISGAAVLVP